MSRYTLRRCTDADRKTLHDLRNETEAWLSARGLEEQAGAHWSGRAHAAIDRYLDDGRFVALCVDGAPVVVGALSGPDLDFWTDDDDLGAAWYIARVMTADHGNGYGALFLEMIAAAAAANGRRALRLDCMRDNTRLHDYYRAQGFGLVRVVQRPWRKSGALFERSLDRLMPAPWDRRAAPADRDGQ
ncbi:GNAT family N-acetyltransferase [Isoptericola sp. BMS4]|uniref:GNAT family N-acetyltransferase n=1 Tax=Isoptericola sp. BMS4 TaxID=2527875 RepID=UPI001422FFDB|nr:GNAT family N-acetyltransferase [Isoptericola sp. BMS4]